MQLTQFFYDLYRPQRLLGKSENTTRLYLISIRNFGRTLATEPTLADLTDLNLIRHIQRMRDIGRSPATCNKDRNQILTLWRHAHRIGLVANYPNVPQLIEPIRTPEAWLAADLVKLFDAIDKQPGHFGRVPRSLWWRTLIMICLDTGERIGAVRQVRWDWFSGEWLRIPAEARKGGRRDRAYRLSHDTLGHLLRVRTVSPVDVFPWPYCGTYLWSLFGQLLTFAGLPHGRRDKFHKLRRTTASVVHQSGGDAQEALDHQYRRTTARYLDPRFTSDRQTCDVLADFLSASKRRELPPQIVIRRKVD
jgi:integrase